LCFDHLELPTVSMFLDVMSMRVQQIRDKEGKK
jgi:hypothetical protein